MSHGFSTLMAYDDFLAANWLSIRRRWWWRGSARYLGIVAGIIFVLNFGTALATGEHSGTRLVADLITAVFCAGIALGVTWLWYLWCIPRSCRKSYAQQQIDGLTNAFEFDAAGIRVASPLGTSTLEWRHITRWIENDRLLMMYRTQTLFYIVPKAQVAPETLSALKAALIAADVPTR